MRRVTKSLTLAALLVPLLQYTVVCDVPQVDFVPFYPSYDVIVDDYYYYDYYYEPCCYGYYYDWWWW